ncbi:MAG: glycerol-3-phosphate 1-O-acyltransferase PlsY [Bacilli bacterium]
MNYIILLFAYLIGSTPSALIIGKVFYNGSDIRKMGSGNQGTTNMLRTLGFRAAIATAVFDVLAKGCIPTFISVILYNNGYISIFPLFIGMVAAIGHAFPIFAKFKGGKMVATSVGILLPIDFRIFLLVAILIIVLFIVTKMMSLSAFISLPIGYFIIAYFNKFNKVEWILTACFFLVILLLHRKNIKLIIQHKERKIDIISMLKTRFAK